MHRVAALALLTAALASASHSQLAGRVLTLVGTPVPDARVEVWSGTTRLAVKITDTAGRYSFPPPQSAFATGVLVRATGFRTTRLPVAPGAKRADMRIELLWSSIAVVTAADARAYCPNRESAAARRAWDALRRRYAASLARSRYAWMEQWQGIESMYHLRDIDGEHLQPRGRGMTSAGVLFVDSTLDRLGYVQPMARGASDRENGPWIFPMIESEQVQQFVQRFFGERHTFSVIPQEGEEKLLAFCPRDRKRPALAGMLRLASDGSPSAVRWIFWNPDSLAVDAGGEVLFAPWDRALSPPVLLPASGLFWRRRRSGDYFARYTLYARWSLDAEADSLLGCKGRCAPARQVY